MNDAEEYVEKLVKSIDVNLSEVAELVEFLHSKDNVFFGEVMTLLQARYENSTGNNCTIVEVTSKVWDRFLWQARNASENEEHDVSYRILKVILDHSETHPWELPNPAYDILV